MSYVRILNRPNWRIELQVPTHPEPTWEPLKATHMKVQFIERADAEAARDLFQRIQPHVTYRVAPM